MVGHVGLLPQVAVQLRVFKKLPYGTCDDLGPSGNALSVLEQVLAHLKAKMRQSGALGVPIDGVVGRVPSGIRQIVPYAQIGHAAQCIEHGRRHACVGIPENPDMPWTARTAHLGRETVDRYERRNDAGLREPHKPALDSIMVGDVKRADPLRARSRVDADVSGDRLTIAFGEDQGRVVEPPIAIDDQTRIAGEQCGRIEAHSKAAREIAGADIRGDVARERRRRQAQAREHCRDIAARMIADDERGRAPRRIE